jgi:hypothetical protein
MKAWNRCVIQIGWVTTSRLRLYVVLDMGNPWVNITLSLPVSVCTHTHDTWVRICTGLSKDTDMGKLSKGTGTDLHGFLLG